MVFSIQIITIYSKVQNQLNLYCKIEVSFWCAIDLFFDLKYISIDCGVLYGCLFEYTLNTRSLNLFI